MGEEEGLAAFGAIKHHDFYLTSRLRELPRDPLSRSGAPPSKASRAIGPMLQLTSVFFTHQVAFKFAGACGGTPLPFY